VAHGSNPEGIGLWIVSNSPSGLPVPRNGRKVVKTLHDAFKREWKTPLLKVLEKFDMEPFYKIRKICKIY